MRALLAFIALLVVAVIVMIVQGTVNAPVYGLFIASLIVPMLISVWDHIGDSGRFDSRASKYRVADVVRRLTLRNQRLSSL